jgi:hypothetical protein
MASASAKSGSNPPSSVSGLAQDRASDGSAHEAPFRIANDGTWFYLGSAIERPEMVRLFVRALKREPLGPSPTGYALVTPYEHHAVFVEDAPFVATELRVEGKGRTQRLIFTTNIGTEVTAGREHPIILRAGCESDMRPYLMLDGDLEARIARSVYYELADRAEHAPDACDPENAAFGVWSGGVFFPLEPSP